MAQFDFSQFFSPRAWFHNLPWVAAGAIGGILIYNWLSTSPVLYVPPAPSMNIGAYGPQPTQTSTYGCVGCGETAAIQMMSPSEETPRF